MTILDVCLNWAIGMMVMNYFTGNTYIWFLNRDSDLWRFTVAVIGLLTLTGCIMAIGDITPFDEAGLAFLTLAGDNSPVLVPVPVFFARNTLLSADLRTGFSFYNPSSVSLIGPTTDEENA